MDQGPPEYDAVGANALSIPEEGLSEVLRAWSGQGQLWEALAKVRDEASDEADWSAKDVRRRAHRILFADLTTALRQWPRRRRDWNEALPAESRRERMATPMPTSGTSWKETRILGWPPRTFVGHSRQRVADTLSITTLRWTLERLMRVWEDAKAIEPSVVAPVDGQMRVARELLLIEPISSTEAIEPTRSDLLAVRREGWPWNSVANVAEELRNASRGSLVELARRMVRPTDVELRWRLFHLGVLGTMLSALRFRGATVKSVRPLSAAATPGPSYLVRDEHGRQWELWFEAADLWRYYGLTSPYSRATAAVRGRDRTLSADLLLMRRGERGLVVECKYSGKSGEVARGGYAQAVTYAMELRTKLVEEAKAVVVGPEETMTGVSSTRTVVGEVGVAPPSRLDEVLDDFLGGASGELG